MVLAAILARYIEHKSRQPQKSPPVSVKLAHQRTFGQPAVPGLNHTHKNLYYYYKLRDIIQHYQTTITTDKYFSTHILRRMASMMGYPRRRKM